MCPLLSEMYIAVDIMPSYLFIDFTIVAGRVL